MRFNPNLELGTFAAYKNGAKIFHSMGLLDFYVNHLSYYPTWNKTETITRLNSMQRGYHHRGHDYPGPQNGNVLVIMPFYGASRGKVTLTPLFLNLTVLSVSRIFPNIAVFVATQEDFDFVVHESGLHKYLYDVQLIADLRTPVHLPFVTSRRTQDLFRNGTYSFDFVFYTETDLILHARDIDQVLTSALAEKHIVVPHRLEPLPRQEDSGPTPVPAKIKKTMKRTMHTKVHELTSLMESSCCFYTKNESVPLEEVDLVRKYEGYSYIAGIGNFFKHLYRPCRIQTPRSYCQRE